MPLAPGWSNVEELLAGVIEVVASVRKVLILANSKKGTNVPDLKVPRPAGVTGEDRKRPATGEELARALGKRMGSPSAGAGVVRYTPKEG